MFSSGPECVNFVTDPVVLLPWAVDCCTDRLDSGVFCCVGANLSGAGGINVYAATEELLFVFVVV